jgi:hypothetical protein
MTETTGKRPAPYEPPLPRGSLRAVLYALKEAGLPADENAARLILKLAIPSIEKHVRREMAKEILFLDQADRECTRSVGPYGSMDVSLQRLARGEPLPYLEILRGGSHPAVSGAGR